MAEHPQLAAVRSLIEELEGLLGDAVESKEYDLVISYAAVLDALKRTQALLEQRTRSV